MADLKLANVNGTLNFSPSLQAMESHRVVAALEKAIERLQLLTLLNYEAAADATALNNTSANGGSTTRGDGKDKTKNGSTQGGPAGGEDKGVGSLLDEQKRLEARYEQLLVATKKVHHNPLDPALDALCFAHVENSERKAHVDELARISTKLKEQSKMLCRQLKENPNDADNWKKITTERSELIVLLSACVREITSSAAANFDASANDPSAAAATYELYAKKVLDEQSAQIWADDLVKKEKEINQNVKQLQSEVKMERQNKERELEECHKKLTELKTELRLLKREVKERSEKMRAETEAAAEGQQRKALDVQRFVRKDISSLRDQMHNEQQVHQDFMSHVNERSKALDEVAAHWDHKNQVEIKKVEGRKVDVEQNRKETADKLKDKSEARILALEEHRLRVEEKRIEESEKTSRETRANDEYGAATKLEAALKGLFTRLALVSLKKKAGKKKR
ncbi:Hypothetical protein, putative [Bodo saltans]|uniref:Dynein regulatory complex protein 9 n=1 Tax=Bodo saltans TaxID=75058 RepID=A0A0S4IT44_BODSA|nr:Hypothetical protein, putative [Bodo saltans]|eukprot:CUF77808.1 Hypothetical protein, putative [Bodo saltans]